MIFHEKPTRPDRIYQLISLHYTVCCADQHTRNERMKQKGQFNNECDEDDQ